ncbi:MAG: ANTAR domain-containing response regulator [Gammaproteobacteria bacterium]
MSQRILLIDEYSERAEKLQAALADSGYQVSAVISSDGNWRQRILNDDSDIVLINMDSPNRDTFEYLSGLKKSHPKPVVMFSNDDDRAIIQEAVKAGVSAYIADGFNAGRLRPILDVAVARFTEFQAMREELEAAKAKLTERKLVDKAKGILMQQKGMDEDTAYRTLRKLAMDRNMKIAEVAEQFIQFSNLLF